MQVILADHNCEGHAKAIFDVLLYYGAWLQLVPMQLQWFRDIKLSTKAKDEEVWQLCQNRGYILLTGNRTASDKKESLESAIRRLVTPDSLPVLTIGNLQRVLADPNYCRACSERLAEIIDDLPKYRGVTRLFIP